MFLTEQAALGHDPHCSADCHGPLSHYPRRMNTEDAMPDGEINPLSMFMRGAWAFKMAVQARHIDGMLEAGWCSIMWLD